VFSLLFNDGHFSFDRKLAPAVIVLNHSSHGEPNARKGKEWGFYERKFAPFYLTS
jgi:hypothetical protein